MTSISNDLRPDAMNPEDFARAMASVGTAATIPSRRMGASSTPEVAALEGLFDGRYELVKELGHGAMGIVYRAQDTGLDRTVAIKIIDPELAKQSGMSALFRREAMALARMRSEHVVQVHSMGTHRESPFIVMEYVEGSDLERILKSYARAGGVVPLHRASTILHQAAQGLAAVHAHGIVHRDVKPSNILVEAGTGRPVIIDFGLAQRPATASCGDAVVLGTPLYMAPEQWEGLGGPAQATVDVYAFGATAFELLTGRPPYEATVAQEVMRMHQGAPVPRVSAVRPSAAAFDAVVARALAKSPSDRYPDASLLADALAEAARETFRAGPPSSGERAPPASLIGGTDLDVLIVDDDESFCVFAQRAVQIAFAGHRLRVRSVPDGEQAVRLARREMPNVVVLDADLPGMNGLETLSRLRELEHGAAARILIVSAANRIERCQVEVLGVTEVVTKPVALRALAEHFAAVVRPRP